MNVFLPYQTPVFWFQIRPEFNILGDSSFKPFFSSSGKLCHFSYEGFIYLEFIPTYDFFISIEIEGKGLCHLLMRNM
jgi:hypothetical protein